MKKLIRIFKKSGLNDKTPSGKELKQEVPTRFGSIFDMVEWFIAASSNVKTVIELADKDAAKSSNDTFDSIKVVDSSYLSLDAIINCFHPISHAETMLEASYTPTITVVLLALEELKKNATFNQRRSTSTSL